MKKLLEYLNLQEDDKLYILGDLFDRSNHNADPIGVYFTVLALRNKCQVIRGNHEQDLAEYIGTYYQTPERKRTKLDTYLYNTFELLQERLTPVDIQNIAKWLENIPLQEEIEVNGEKYLLAHAMTINPSQNSDDKVYLQGSESFSDYLDGEVGSVSISKDGDIRCWWSNETTDEEEFVVDSFDVNRFESRFLKLPYVHKAGMIVKYTPIGELGVLATGKED